MEIDEENRVFELDEDDAVLLALATPKIARLVNAVEAVLVDGHFTPDGTYRTSAHGSWVHSVCPNWPRAAARRNDSPKGR